MEAMKDVKYSIDHVIELLQEKKEGKQRKSEDKKETLKAQHLERIQKVTETVSTNYWKFSHS